MAIASGTRVNLSYVVESTRGTTPGSPTMKQLRTIGRNINLEKDMLLSQEVRSSRQISDLRHGFNKVSGTIPAELNYTDYADVLALLLGGTWAQTGDQAAQVSGVNLAITVSPSTITRASGSFVTDGYRVGYYVTTTGFSNAANNGTFLVTAVSALSLTLAETTLAAEGATSGRTVEGAGDFITIGTQLKTMTVERRFEDLSLYQVFKGVAVSSADIKIEPTSMVGLSLGLVGMSGTAPTGSSLGSPTAASASAPFGAFDGAIYENGAVIAVITALNIKIDNSRSVVPVVGSKFSPDVFEGQCKVTGDVTAFFENATVLNKFINETSSSIQCKLVDPSGKFMSIYMPKVKYTGGMIDPPQEGPVPISLPFQALEDTSHVSSIVLQTNPTIL